MRSSLPLPARPRLMACLAVDRVVCSPDEGAHDAGVDLAKGEACEA